MEIRRIEYKNVYGSLSSKLEFSRGENFLVGINGSGKTTVLNLLRWVLKPSLPHLCTLHHDLIKIDVKHGKYVYSLQSRIKENIHELKVVTKDPSRDFKPIITTLTVMPHQIPAYSLEEIRGQYEHLSPETHEVSTWSFLIEELPSPIFIGLKRSIKEKASNAHMGLKTKYAGFMETESSHTSAIELIRDAFNTGRRLLVEINDDLNRKVLELSFSGVLHNNMVRAQPSQSDRAKKIERLRSRFVKTTEEGSYSKALSDDGVRTAIVQYLDDLSALLNTNKKDDDIWLTLNRHNFDRAAKMFDLFEKHEKKAYKVQREMNSFTREVNRFIGDSGKSIHFNANTGNPFFRSSTCADKLRLSELSSGEAQVIVLLSYFAFLAKEGIPIIIDEPELSLHVQWQKDFVGSVKAVMPEDCQTIMATHSPEICGAEDVNVQSISVRAVK